MNQNEITLRNFRTIGSLVAGADTIFFLLNIALRFGGFFEILTEHKKFVVAVKREFVYRKKSKMGKGSECLDFENPTQRTEIIVFQLSIPLQKIFQLRFS